MRDSSRHERSLRDVADGRVSTLGVPKHGSSVGGSGEGDPAGPESPRLGAPATADPASAEPEGCDDPAGSWTRAARKTGLREIVWGAVAFCLALSGLGAYAAITGAGFPGGAGLWPVIAGIVLGGLGLAATVQAILRPRTGRSRRETSRAASSEVLASRAVAFFACAVAYLICMQTVGFLPATLLFGAGAMAVLMQDWRARAIWIVALCAVTFGLNFLFTMVFAIPFPGAVP